MMIKSMSSYLRYLTDSFIYDKIKGGRGWKREHRRQKYSGITFLELCGSKSEANGKEGTGTGSVGIGNEARRLTLVPPATGYRPQNRYIQNICSNLRVDAP